MKVDVLVLRRSWGVVEERRQSGATLSEVCRRHQVDHARFYRWERLARQGALEALRNGGRKPKNGKHEAWLMSGVNRLRAVVAEVIAENLSLKGGSWWRPNRRYTEKEKRVLLDTVSRAQEQSGQPLSGILAELGLTRYIYYDRLGRAKEEVLTAHKNNPLSP